MVPIYAAIPYRPSILCTCNHHRPASRRHDPRAHDDRLCSSYNPDPFSIRGIKERTQRPDPPPCSNEVFKSARARAVSKFAHVRLAIGSQRICTYELGHEGNHEVEETNGLDESETQNGVGEELATKGRVAGNAVDEGGEDETDTDTGTGKTDGSRAHTKVLGDLDHSLGDLRRVGAAGLEVESLAGGGVENRRHLLALQGLHGRGLAGT